MLLGISGKSKAGKDCLYSIAAQYGWTKLSFAAPLKEMARQHFSLGYAHVDGDLKDVPCEALDGHTPREFLIDLGNLYRRYDSDYWVKRVVEHIQKFPDTNYMITDVRYPNEATAIRNYGGVLVRLERHPRRDSLVSEETKQSVSETALDNYNKWDFKLEAQDNENQDDLGKFWNILSNVLKMKI